MTPRECGCGCGELIGEDRDPRAIYIDRIHKQRAKQRRRHRDPEYNRARYLRRIEYYREYERRRRSIREAA